MKNRALWLGMTILFVVLFSALTLSACNNTEEDPVWQKERVAAANLYADDYEYKDYANEVYYDTETHPLLKEQGLFWIKWNEDTKRQEEFNANTDEGAALVDVNKPTIIMVHGMMSDGHKSKESFYLNSNISIPEEFGLPSDYTNVSLARLWQIKGWNVGYYHYAKFTSQSVSFDVGGIEEKIWGSGGKDGITYKMPDGSIVKNATPFSLSEHFAADYIRALNRLPEAMGQKEIRIASHSMGGELITAGMFLLTELADVGQIEFGKIPSRYAMLDPYFSITLSDGSDYKYLGASGIRLAWSQKLLCKNNVTLTMLECVKDLKANGIAIEYYAYETSFLRLAMVPIIEELINQSVYVLGLPDYGDYSPVYNIVYDGHNAIRDWYFCSIVFDPVKDISPNAAENTIAASASTPTEMIKQLTGTAFIIEQGAKTIRSDDDGFVKITWQQMQNKNVTEE